MCAGLFGNSLFGRSASVQFVIASTWGCLGLPRSFHSAGEKSQHAMLVFDNVI